MRYAVVFTWSSLISSDRYGHTEANNLAYVESGSSRSDCVRCQSRTPSYFVVWYKLQFFACLLCRQRNVTPAAVSSTRASRTPHPHRSSVRRGIVSSPKTLGTHKISAQAQPEQSAPRGAYLSPRCGQPRRGRLRPSEGHRVGWSTHPGEPDEARRLRLLPRERGQGGGLEDSQEEGVTDRTF